MRPSDLAVLERCWTEGIPKVSILNRYSTVSPGLEATIREWFARPLPPPASEGMHAKLKPRRPSGSAAARPSVESE